MKILYSTLVVRTEPDGSTTETKVVDPNFRPGLSYEIPELGPGRWTVTEVGEPATAFVGGKSVATTRVAVVPEIPGTPPAPEAAPATDSKARFGPKSSPKPVPKPTQRTRHTPK